MLLAATAELGVTTSAQTWVLTPGNSWNSRNVNNTHVHALSLSLDTAGAMVGLRYGRAEVASNHTPSMSARAFDGIRANGLNDISYVSGIASFGEVGGIHELLGTDYVPYGQPFRVSFCEPVASHVNTSFGGSSDSAFVVELQRLDGGEAQITCRLNIWFTEF
jgi:hypothetical protein